MSGARARILASIRDGLVRAHLPAETPASPIPPAEPAGPQGSDTLAEQFGAALRALAGHVHHADGARAAAEIIAGIARENDAVSFISWDEDAIGCPGLLAALAACGLSRVAYDVSEDAGRRLLDTDRLAGVGLGVTGAHAALAENGGLVLVSGPGRGRLPSILPPVHVAVVSVRRLRPGLADLVREEPRLLEGGSNVVIVAGPSRTADIEMTLTHGVHGPRHVHVVLMA